MKWTALCCFLVAMTQQCHASKRSNHQSQLVQEAFQSSSGGIIGDLENYTKQIFSGKSAHWYEDLGRLLLVMNNLIVKSNLTIFNHIGESWLENFVQPLCMEIYGLQGTWDDVVKHYIQVTELMTHEDPEYCVVLPMSASVYAAAPLAIGTAEGFMEAKHPFPSYNIEAGETGVFNLNEPMSVNGQPNYVPVDQIGKIKDTGVITIGLVGDWGIGTIESMVMTDYLTELNKTQEVHYTFHLGDVYWTGEAGQVNYTMLGKGECPYGNRKVTKFYEGSRGTFALNGNHEMYDRGFGYFDTLLPAYNQPASYGLFQSEYWNFFMLDSGYNCLPEVIGIPSAIEYALHASGDPQNVMPEEIFDWLEDPTLNLINPESTQSMIITQHMQLFQPFVDPGGFGTKASMSESEYMEYAVGKNMQYLQTLMKQKGFKNGYSPIGLWGHDHKSMAMNVSIPKSVTGISVNLLGQLMGQGGFINDAPGAYPMYPDKFGAQWYDDAIYMNVSESLGLKSLGPFNISKYLGTQKAGYNGFNVITINGTELKLEYFRSDPSQTPSAILMGYRIFQSHGLNQGAEEIANWFSPELVSWVNENPLNPSPATLPPSSSPTDTPSASARVHACMCMMIAAVIMGFW